MPPAKKEKSEADDEADEEATPPTKPVSTFDFMHSAKLAIFMFLVYLVVMSDVFIERVMSPVGADLVVGRIPTRKGMVIQGLLLATGLIVMDFLIGKEVI